MKCIHLGCAHFTYEIIDRITENAEPSFEGKEGTSYSYDNVDVLLVSAEPADRLETCDVMCKMIIPNLNVMRQVLVVPFAHGSSRPANTGLALKLLERLYSGLSQSFLCPPIAGFGWRKQFRMVTAHAFEHHYDSEADLFAEPPTSAKSTFRVVDIKGHEVPPDRGDKVWLKQIGESPFKGLKTPVSTGIFHPTSTDAGHYILEERLTRQKGALARLVSRILETYAHPIESPLMWSPHQSWLSKYWTRFPQRSYGVVTPYGSYKLRFAACPGAFEYFKKKAPEVLQGVVRVFEIAQCHRYEQSGEISPLLRNRNFTMLDVHMAVPNVREQILQQIRRGVKICQRILHTVGLQCRFIVRYVKGVPEEILDAFRCVEVATLIEEVWSQRKFYFLVKSEFVFEDPAGTFTSQLATVQLDDVNGRDVGLKSRGDYLPGLGQHSAIIHMSPGGSLERLLKCIEAVGGLPYWASEGPLYILSMIAPDQLRKILPKIPQEYQRTIETSPKRLGPQLKTLRKQGPLMFVVVGPKNLETGVYDAKISHQDRQQHFLSGSIEEIFTARAERFQEVRAPVS